MQLDSVENMLPESVRDIASIVGLAVALRLVEEFGGLTFAVSKNHTQEGQAAFAALVDVIGQNAAEILTSHYGGDTIYIPRCVEALRELRDRAIRAEFDQMVNNKFTSVYAVNRLVQRYGISDRWVWEILKRVDQVLINQSNQSNLF